MSGATAPAARFPASFGAASWPDQGDLTFPSLRCAGKDVSVIFRNVP
jgi:hypothetical protein